MRKLIYYAGKGLREIYKPDMTDEEKQKAEKLKKQDEKIMMHSVYIAEILFSEINNLY
jgi:endonuclease IV